LLGLGVKPITKQTNEDTNRNPPKYVMAICKFVTSVSKPPPALHKPIASMIPTNEAVSNLAVLFIHLPITNHPP